MGKITLNKKAQETAEQFTDSISDTVQAVEQSVKADVAETWDDPAIIKEDESKATANSRHFVMNNGTAKTVFSASPMNFYDETQKRWRPIDNSLKDVGDGYEAKFGKFKARVSKADKKKAVEIEGNGMSLSWEYLGKSAPKEPTAAMARTLIKAAEKVAVPTVQSALAVKESVKDAGRLSTGSEAVYENADENTDIQYKFQGNNVKENIIVKERADEYRYLFALDTKGLKMRLSEDNKSIELCSGAGDEQNVEFTIPSPFMYDAKGAVSDEVYYEIEGETDGKYTFAVVADSAWINEFDRVLPVIIDPQINTYLTNNISHQVYSADGNSSTGKYHNGKYWRPIYFPNIVVSKSMYNNFRTVITIQKKNLGLRDMNIAGAQLILKPTLIDSCCEIEVDNKVLKLETNDHEDKIIDITDTFKLAGEVCEINMECVKIVANANFSADVHLEVDYLANEDTCHVVETFDLANSMTGRYSVITSEMTAMFEDVPASDSVLDYGITHIFKKDWSARNFGKNIRLNLNESLIKNGNNRLNFDYVYTDETGDKHGFKETFYYIDKNGIKQTVSDKNSIEVDLDGKLFYTVEKNKYEIHREQRSSNGLSIKTVIDGYKYAEYVEQKTDEYKQIEDQRRAYYNSLESMVIVKEDDGSDVLSLRDIIRTDNKYTQEKYSTFLVNAKKPENLLCTESEALNYKSLLLQLKSLDMQIKSTKLQRESLDLQVDSLDYQEAYNGGIINDGNSSDYTKAYYEKINGDLPVQKRIAREQYSLTNNDVNNNQVTIVNKQIQQILNNKTRYLDQLENYYKEYLNIKHRFELYERQMPINYITDGKIVKGFNKEGNLVAIFDKYDNQMTVEYDIDGRITKVYDGENDRIVFEYNSNGLLQNIIDTRGRKTSYTYDKNDHLINVTFANGKKIDITYDIYDDIVTVISSDKYKTTLSYSNRRLNQTITKSETNNIAFGQKQFTANPESISEITFSYSNNKTVISDKNGNKKYYIIGANGNVSEYYEEENNKVVKAEKYAKYGKDEKDDNGKSSPYNREVLRYAKATSLHSKPYSSFTASDFAGGDREETIFDEFDNPKSRTTNERKLSDNTTQQSTVTYDYDNNHRCVKETAVISINGLLDTNGLPKEKSYTQITTYNYNAAGDIVRKETWVENEQLTRGVDIEETEYDEKGNVLHTVSYNSLDSSSKFYSESEYNEQGQTVADIDESGENRTEYEYIPGNSVVRSKKLPNGSKFSYGHDIDDTVTSITQSTDDGEGNSTQTTYTCGLPTQHISGNNTVQYSYDHKRRVKNVNLNGVEYIDNTYTDGTGTNNDTIRTDFVSRDGVKFDRVTVTKNKRGDVLSVKTEEVDKIAGRPGTEVYSYSYEYDNKHRVARIFSGAVTLETNVYDTLDRQRVHTFGSNSHETSYNDYGNISTDTITFNNSTTDKLVYEYTYAGDSARELSKITAGDYSEEYEQDCLGRKKKNVQTLGGITHTQRFGYYKAGDHATNRLNTIYYGKNGETDGKVTYTYDNMGNITSVNENGKQKYKYSFDKLGRLISEKDIDKDTEICYTYDDSGNILTKSVNGVTTDYRYKDGTDRLLSFGNESFVYDGMGNPTTYRNMECKWEKGRQLAQVIDSDRNVFKFTYDVFGVRTSKTVNGITTHYVYENGKLLRQTTHHATGDEQIDFIYGRDGIIGFKHNNEPYLYRKNLFGDVVEIYDQSGSTVGRYSYTAFGECSIELDIGSIASKNPIRYRGYCYDEELGLYYLKSRYYDPEIGRFITIDDLSYLDPENINGLNLYAYCGNNPVMCVDPDGTAKWWQWLLFGIGAALVVAAAVVLTVATGGAAAGLIGAIAVGAAKGALIGAAVGSVVGIAGGAIYSAVTGADLGDSILSGFLMGFGIGAVVGAVIGGAVGGVSYQAGLSVPQSAPKEVGNYLLRDANGNVRYTGVGNRERMMTSLRNKSKVVPDLIAEFRPAPNRAMALAREAMYINEYGGALSMNKFSLLLNKINSPGLKMLFWWL